MFHHNQFTCAVGGLGRLLLPYRKPPKMVADAQEAVVAGKAKAT